MPNPLRLGIFSALQQVSERQRGRKEHDLALQQALEDRRREQDERERQHSLEDVLRQRQEEQYEYQKSQRPLEEAMKRAQISGVYAKQAAASRPKAKSLPMSAIEKDISLDNMMSSAGGVKRSLEDAVASGTNATGRFLGMKTPTWAKNFVGMGGEKGQHVRNIIGQLKATIAKERAGTSMTPGELDLLESYVPNDNDDETQAIQKAQDFINTLDDIKRNRAKAYAGHGFGAGDEQAPDDEQALPYSSY